MVCNFNMKYAKQGSKVKWRFLLLYWSNARHYSCTQNLYNDTWRANFINECHLLRELKVQVGDSSVLRSFQLGKLRCWLARVLPPEVTFSLGLLRPSNCSFEDGWSDILLAWQVQLTVRIISKLSFGWSSDCQIPWKELHWFYKSDRLAIYKSLKTLFSPVQDIDGKYQNGPWMKQNWFHNMDSSIWTENWSHDHMTYVSLNPYNYSYFRSEWVSECFRQVLE